MVRRMGQLLSGKIECEVCGSFYEVFTWHAYRDGKYRIRVWQCQKRAACGAPHVSDEALGIVIDVAIKDMWQVRRKFD